MTDAVAPVAPMARWKDLCVDAVDPASLGAFWAAVTGLDLAVGGDHVTLDGPTDAHRVWVNAVDRPHTVKNRLHLDVDAASVDDVVALGARVLSRAEDTGFGWHVLADPEGNELCVFVREPADVPAYRLHGVVIDSVDAVALATWWGGVLGAEPVLQAELGWATLEGVAVDDRMTLDFVPVPEPRTVPNRVHWDLWGDVDAVVAAGATRLWEGRSWTVLADPEGNEFCVFAP